MRGQRGQGSKKGSKILGERPKNKPEGKPKRKTHTLALAERKESRASQRRRSDASSVATNPGGYVVLDGTVPVGRGKTIQLGRVVRNAEKFEAWNKVEGGYMLIGTFDQPDKAIAALGPVGSARNRPSARGRGRVGSGTHK